MRARLRLVPLLLSVGLLGGCAAGPDYRRPEIALKADFVGEPRITNRQREGRTDLRAWWEAFGDPLLTRYARRPSNKISTSRKRAREWRKRAPHFDCRPPHSFLR
jgi:hypothetical protein